MILLGADFSQIEARVLCWLFGQLDMLERFRKGVDIYSEFGNQWLYPRHDPPISKDDPRTAQERVICKECILGCGFGLSGPGFQAALLRRGIVVDPEFAARAVANYRLSVPCIERGWRDLSLAIGQHLCENGSPASIYGLEISPGRVQLPSGRALRYHGLRFELDTWSRPQWFWLKQGRKVERLYGARLTENVVQAIARDIMADVIKRLRWMYKGSYDWMIPKLSVHDELIWVLPKRACVMASEVIKKVMTSPPQWALSLPISVEVRSGRSYYDLK